MAEKLYYEYYMTLVTLMRFLSLSCFADKEKFVTHTVDCQEHCSAYLVEKVGCIIRFHLLILHILTYSNKSFISPTNTQLICFKILKFTLKYTIKGAFIVYLM